MYVCVIFVILGEQGANCVLDEALVLKFEAGYMAALNAALSAALPGGTCNPATYSKDVYNAFAV